MTTAMLKTILMMLMLPIVLKSLVDGRVVSKEKQQDFLDLEEQKLPKFDGLPQQQPTINRVFPMPSQSAFGTVGDGREPFLGGKRSNIAFIAIHLPETVSLADEHVENSDDLHTEKRFDGNDRNAVLHNVNRWLARRYGYFDTLASRIIKK